MTADRVLIETDFGPMVALWTDAGLASLSFSAAGAKSSRPARAPSTGREKAMARQLQRFMKTGRWDFGVPLDLSAGTDFDRKVWRAMLRIPPGSVRTYGEIARAIGRPRSSRAVGNACGRNPVPVVIPCHRVVAAGGPGGFGLGLKMKRRLLELEGVRV